MGNVSPYMSETEEEMYTKKKTTKPGSFNPDKTSKKGQSSSTPPTPPPSSSGKGKDVPMPRREIYTESEEESQDENMVVAEPDLPTLGKRVRKPRVKKSKKAKVIPTPANKKVKKSDTTIATTPVGKGKRSSNPLLKTLLKEGEREKSSTTTESVAELVNGDLASQTDVDDPPSPSILDVVEVEI